MSARYIVEPQRNDMPKGAASTWFVRCIDADAEHFAVIDTVLDEVIEDLPTRAAAEQLAARLESTPEPPRDDRWAEHRALGGDCR